MSRLNRRKSDRWQRRMAIAANVIALGVLVVALLTLSDRAEAQWTTVCAYTEWEPQDNGTLLADGDCCAERPESGAGLCAGAPPPDPDPEPEPDPEPNLAKPDTWSAWQGATVSGEPVDGQLTIGPSGQSGAVGANSPVGGELVNGTVYEVTFTVDSCSTDCRIRVHMGVQPKPVVTGVGEHTVTVTAANASLSFVVLGSDPDRHATISGLTIR